MPVTRLNHAVLYVSDLERTQEFYENVLGFRTLISAIGQAAFFQAPGSTNDHDLGTFQIGAGAGASQAGRSTVGLYHLAWEVDTLAELARLQQRLADAGALVGASDHSSTKSLYAQDPDGIEFEVCWVVPLALRTGATLVPAAVYFAGSGHHGIVRPPIPTERSGDGLRADVSRITQVLAHELEALIRRAPEQWHLLQPNWPSDYDLVGG
jgi:catechol 2,3-dioxygenase-like lactoylglutathione lyase family enzyme